MRYAAGSARRRRPFPIRGGHSTYCALLRVAAPRPSIPSPKTARAPARGSHLRLAPAVVAKLRRHHSSARWTLAQRLTRPKCASCPVRLATIETIRRPRPCSTAGWFAGRHMAADLLFVEDGPLANPHPLGTFVRQVRKPSAQSCSVTAKFGCCGCSQREWTEPRSLPEPAKWAVTAHLPG